MSSIMLDQITDADAQRKLRMAMELRVNAKTHELQAKTLKEESDLLAKEVMERLGTSSVENDAGYKMNYIRKMGSKFDQKKLTEVLVLEGVDPQLVADAVTEATSFYPMEYIELRAPKE